MLPLSRSRARSRFFGALASSAWTPAALGADLALWLDADDAATITLDGSNVSQWDDKSGNGRHVSQANAALQPPYSATGLLGKPTLDFGSAVNSRALTNAALTGYSPVRYFGVADYDGPNPFQTFTGILLHAPIADFNLDRTMTASSGTSWSGTGVTLYHNGADPTLTALPVISLPFVFATNFSQTANKTSVSIGTAGTDRSWRGKISEIISTSFVPSTADRQKIEGYLAWKWGLEANLPADHPYKTAPPTV